MLLDSEPLRTLVFLEAVDLGLVLTVDMEIPATHVPSSEVANEVIGEAGQAGAVLRTAGGLYGPS